MVKKANLVSRDQLDVLVSKDLEVGMGRQRITKRVEVTVPFVDYLKQTYFSS